MEHYCCAHGCTGEHVVLKETENTRDENEMVWIVHVKTFYEIYESYVGAKKNLCKCEFVNCSEGQKKVYKCNYCRSIAAFQFTFHWFYDDNKKKDFVISQVRVSMQPYWKMGCLVNADIHLKKYTGQKEHLCVEYV